MPGHDDLLCIADRSIEELIAFVEGDRASDGPVGGEVAVDLGLALPHLGVIVHEGITRAGAVQIPAAPAGSASTVDDSVALAAIVSEHDHRTLIDRAARLMPPVFNAGTGEHRPLQVLADLLVLTDLLGPMRGRSMVITDGEVAYVRSWIDLCVRIGIHLTLLPTAIGATGLSRFTDDSTIAHLFGSHLTVADDPCAALRRADVIAGEVLLPRRDAHDTRIELPLDLSGRHADAGSGVSEGARTLLFHRVERAKDVVAAFVRGQL